MFRYSIFFLGALILGFACPLKAMHSIDRSWSSSLYKHLATSLGSLFTKNKDSQAFFPEIAVALEEKNYTKILQILCTRADLDLFVPLLVSHVSSLIQDHQGREILSYIAKKNPSHILAITACLKEQLSKISIPHLMALAQIDAFGDHIDHMVVNLVNNGDAVCLVKGLYYAHSMGKMHLPFILTPTGRHIYQHFAQFNRPPFLDYQNNEELLSFLTKIIEKERELNAAGYYTFLHGQKKAYYLPEKLYTLLWQEYKEENAPEFFFAHVKPLVVDELAKKQEERVRNYLLAHGRKPKDNYTRQKLLFLNYAFFAQLNDIGSNTAYYVLHNRNWGSMPIAVTCKDAFTYFGYTHIYEKYKQEIEELQKTYEKGLFGNVLCIAAPKEKVAECIIPCEAAKGLSGRGGVRRSVRIAGIGATTDMRLIMETLLNEPERITNTDDIEFCMIMTQSRGGLDPKTGIKVYPLLSGNESILADLQEKEETLWRRIQHDIQMEKKALSRAIQIAGHCVPENKEAALRIKNAAGRIGILQNQALPKASSDRVMPSLGQEQKDPLVMVKYAELIKELKKRFAQEGNIVPSLVAENERYSITHYYASKHAERYQDLVRKHPFLETIFAEVISREKEMSGTHYPFYHAQKFHVKVFQDFIKEVYELVQMQHLESFFFLRNPALFKPRSVDEFLDLYRFSYGLGLYFDHRKKDDLLSVNLSLLGNLEFAGECSLNFYLSNWNINAPSLKSLCKHFDIEERDVQARLKAIEDRYSKNHGVILQILIPKEKVDSFVYLAEPMGIPYRGVVLNKTYNFMKNRQSSISSVLELIRKDPKALSSQATTFQGRILFDPTMMLNPKSGVQIHCLEEKRSALAMILYADEIKSLAKEYVQKCLGEQRVPLRFSENTPLEKLYYNACL